MKYLYMKQNDEKQKGWTNTRFYMQYVYTSSSLFRSNKKTHANTF